MSAAFCQRKLLLQQKLQSKFDVIKTLNHADPMSSINSNDINCSNHLINNYPGARSSIVLNGSMSPPIRHCKAEKEPKISHSSPKISSKNCHPAVITNNNNNKSFVLLDEDSEINNLDHIIRAGIFVGKNQFSKNMVRKTNNYCNLGSDNMAMSSNRYSPSSTRVVNKVASDLFADHMASSTSGMLKSDQKEKFSSCHDLRIAAESPNWYFPNLSRDGSEAILTLGKEYGNVLMRKSTSYDGNYVVSARYDCKGVTEIRHYEVTSFSFDSGEKKYLLRVIGQHPMLDSLESVLEYFLGINPGMRPLCQDKMKHISWRELLDLTSTNNPREKKSEVKNTFSKKIEEGKINDYRRFGGTFEGLIEHKTLNYLSKGYSQNIQNKMMSPNKYNINEIMSPNKLDNLENDVGDDLNVNMCLNLEHLDKKHRQNGINDQISNVRMQSNLKLSCADSQEEIPNILEKEEVGSATIITPNLLKPSMFKGEKCSLNSIIKKKAIDINSVYNFNFHNSNLTSQSDTLKEEIETIPLSINTKFRMDSPKITKLENNSVMATRLISPSQHSPNVRFPSKDVKSNTSTQLEVSRVFLSPSQKFNFSMSDNNNCKTDANNSSPTYNNNLNIRRYQKRIDHESMPKLCSLKANINTEYKEKNHLVFNGNVNNSAISDIINGIKNNPVNKNENVDAPILNSGNSIKHKVNTTVVTNQARNSDYEDQLPLLLKHKKEQLRKVDCNNKISIYATENKQKLKEDIPVIGPISPTISITSDINDSNINSVRSSPSLNTSQAKIMQQSLMNELVSIMKNKTSGDMGKLSNNLVASPSFTQINIACSLDDPNQKLKKITTNLKNSSNNHLIIVKDVSNQNQVDDNYCVEMEKM